VDEEKTENIELVISVLIRTLRAEGWQWRWITRWLGIGRSTLDGLRRLYDIEPPHSRDGNIRRDVGKWKDEEEFMQWFIQHDPASVFYDKEGNDIE